MNERETRKAAIAIGKGGPNQSLDASVMPQRSVTEAAIRDFRSKVWPLCW